MSVSGEILLSIAIPTWKRADYLRQNLEQLQRELATVPDTKVEVVVSDNCSPDDTPDVVRQAVAGGLAVRYVRNPENIGWGRNFFQCFNLAEGRYVWVLGDDDLLLDGTLALLVPHLRKANFGVVCIRPYGFDHDFRGESPGRAGSERVFEGTDAFLEAIGALATMISAVIVNKRTMGRVDTGQLFCGDLAHLHLVLIAALSSPHHLFIDRALIACKRNNSASYKFSKVFVQEYWQIMDSYVARGLAPRTLRVLERKLLLSYYPFYLFLERLADNGDHRISAVHFAERFGQRGLYRYWIAPTLHWPRPLALGWAAATTAIGRVAGGEVRRGLWFALAKFRRRLAGRCRQPS